MRRVPINTSLLFNKILEFLERAEPEQADVSAELSTATAQTTTTTACQPASASEAMPNHKNEATSAANHQFTQGQLLIEEPANIHSNQPLALEHDDRLQHSHQLPLQFDGTRQPQQSKNNDKLRLQHDHHFEAHQRAHAAQQTQGQEQEQEQEQKPIQHSPNKSLSQPSYFRILSPATHSRPFWTLPSPLSSSQSQSVSSRIIVSFRMLGFMCN